MIRFVLLLVTALAILAAPQCCLTTHADEQPTHVATITIDLPTVSAQSQVATPTLASPIACQGPNCESCVGCTDCRDCPSCPSCPQGQPSAYLQTWHPAVGITYKQRYLNKVARLIDPSRPIVCRPGYVIQ